MRIGLTLTFLEDFEASLWIVLPLLVFLGIAIALLGLAVGAGAGWSRPDSVHWSFTTATTGGYGDVRPAKPASKILAIVTALLGLVLTGIIAATALHAGNIALHAQH